MTDFNEMVRRADEEYRRAEALIKEGKPLSYLVTLSFLTKEEAITFIESIKTLGGVVTKIEFDDLSLSDELTITPASVMDFHPWGGEKES